MQTHGIDRVRQALQGATGPDVRNPAGFITWYLRQPSMGSAIKAEPVEQESVIQRSPALEVLADAQPALARRRVHALVRQEVVVLSRRDECLRERE